MNVREKEEECGQVVLKKIIDLGRKKVERVVTANKQSSNNNCLLFLVCAIMALIANFLVVLVCLNTNCLG